LVTLVDRPIFAATVPNKVQAYLAVGRPIIASLDGEGARIVVEADAGLASPAEDAKALAQAILNLYRSSPDELRAMGENGRKYYQEHFDHDYLVDQLTGFLRQASQIGRDYR
jgi:glycosyltransferase involved in cell wall biosynthesis